MWLLIVATCAGLNCTEAEIVANFPTEEACVAAEQKMDAKEREKATFCKPAGVESKPVLIWRADK